MKRFTEIIFLIFIAFAVANSIEEDCTKSPPVIKVNKSCCAIPVLLDKDVVKKCSDDMQNRTDTRNPITKYCVLKECILKSYKKMADATVVSNPHRFIEKGLSLINKTVTWLNIATAAFDKCIEKATTNIEKFREMIEKKPYEVDLSVCDPIYMYRHNCFALELFKNCPASEFEDNETCNEWKTYLNDCGDSIYNTKLHRQ